MKELLAKLEQVMQTGVTNRDQANDLLAQCYNVINNVNDLIEKTKTRTKTQNRCIHDYCGMMADALNEAGYDFTSHVRVMKHKGVDVPWDKEKFKTDVWHRVQFAMFPEAVDAHGKPSTTALDTKQVSSVYEVVNAKMADHGVSMPWPDRFNKG